MRFIETSGRIDAGVGAVSAVFRGVGVYVRCFRGFL